MTLLRRMGAALAFKVVTSLPPGAVGRARVSGRLAPLLERIFALIGRPLNGTALAVAEGPGEGLGIVGERRSLAWLSGRVEPEIQSILERELGPGDVFVDAGASIGFFSLLAARIVGPSGRAIAFEPQPVAAASVRTNVELNGFENVTVVEAALSNARGTAMLRGVGTATAHLTTAGEAIGGLRVDRISLDDFLAERPAIVPDLVKIDVEGHEASVLAGMQTTLAEDRPTLVVELHGDPRGIVETLEAADYVVSVIGTVGIAARDAEPAAHLLARPLDAAVP
jgi:FkbM family methyltransferase